jgi:hypothetical protein
MRMSYKILFLCLTTFASVAFASPGGLEFTMRINEGDKPLPCEENPNVTPSLQICAFERNGERQYYIDTREGSHVRLAIVDGDVSVLSAGPNAVRVTLSDAAPYPDGVITELYRDAALEIDSLVDAKNQVTWLVRPLAIPEPSKSQLSDGKCKAAGCSVNSYTLPMMDGHCTAAGCSVNSDR